METQIKTEEDVAQYQFLERIEGNGQNQVTNEEIVSACQTFNQLMNAFDVKKVQLKLEDLQELYNIEIYHIEALDINGVKAIHEQIMTRYKNSKSKRNWYQNELRIFVWILFHYSEIRRKPIQKFGEEEWKFVSTAFVGKTIEDVKFEWLLLTKSTATSLPWTEEENELLENLMSQEQYQNKWIDIAKMLYLHCKSENFRKPKQCRERWKNYLNPTIQKGEWTLEEDRRLFELVKKLGKKWSNISKEIGTRTEHSVKNRYKSLLKKYKKDNSIRQKAKSTKGLHTKELEQISSIIEQIDKRINEKITVQQTPKEKEEEIITREELAFERFYPISPRSAWKYYDKTIPPVLSIIQSPRIISPKMNSPGFRYPMATWEEETNKLFYS